jgi:hypothetical protein
MHGEKDSGSMKRNAEIFLNKRLRFEELISHLSATFVNLPPQKVEMEIESGLKSYCNSIHGIKEGERVLENDL